MTMTGVRMRRVMLVFFLSWIVAPTHALTADALPGVAVAGETALTADVYERVGSQLLWSTRGSPTAQATALLDILRAVDSRGLRPSDYSPELIAAASRDPDRFDPLLTAAAIRLISHLHYGRIDPRAAGFELDEPRTDLDVVAAVAALAAAPNVDAAVTAAEPHFYHYVLLKAALLRYRTLAEDPTLTQLPHPGNRTLHAGDPYAGAPALRRLLVALGDLPAPAPVPVPGPANANVNIKADAPANAATADDTLDAALVHALRHFQERHGMTVDGTLSDATFEALTTPMTQRVRQIELTLERWRWLPAFDSPPIIVNIPEFRLFAFDTTADRVASILQMPVIVGQTYPSKRTPVFVGEMRYVVFRPYWDVPRSITVHEMLPKIRGSAEYLARNHLEIVRGDSDTAEVMAPTPDTVARLAAGELRLRQQPGDDNALGLVKFLFPNAHNVYLHSTPAHQLFAASRRAFSHGCIRVSDPAALAGYVLRDESGWDAARIDAAMHGDKTLRVQLHRPIHVMILYGTAMATEAGDVQFFDDIYGHDRKLETLLGLASVSRAR